MDFLYHSTRGNIWKKTRENDEYLVHEKKAFSSEAIVRHAYLINLFLLISPPAVLASRLASCFFLQRLLHPVDHRSKKVGLVYS